MLLLILSVNTWPPSLHWTFRDKCRTEAEEDTTLCWSEACTAAQGWVQDISCKQVHVGSAIDLSVIHQQSSHTTIWNI